MWVDSGAVHGQAAAGHSGPEAWPTLERDRNFHSLATTAVSPAILRFRPGGGQCSRWTFRPQLWIRALAVPVRIIERVIEQVASSTVLLSYALAPARREHGDGRNPSGTRERTALFDAQMG